MKMPAVHIPIVVDGMSKRHATILVKSIIKGAMKNRREIKEFEKAGLSQVAEFRKGVLFANIQDAKLIALVAGLRRTA